MRTARSESHREQRRVGFRPRRPPPVAEQVSDEARRGRPVRAREVSPLREVLRRRGQPAFADLAGQLRTTRLLQQNYPDERTNRLNFAAVLAELGERRAAAELVAYDPIAGWNKTPAAPD